MTALVRICVRVIELLTWSSTGLLPRECQLGSFSEEKTTNFAGGKKVIEERKLMPTFFTAVFRPLYLLNMPTTSCTTINCPQHLIFRKYIAKITSLHSGFPGSVVRDLCTNLIWNASHLIWIYWVSTTCLWSSANSNFELGRGSNSSDWRPQIVPSLKNVHVIQVACGGYHSLALTGMFYLLEIQVFSMN